jgi:hypothetical protein
MHFVPALNFAIIVPNRPLNSKRKIEIVVNHISLIYNTLWFSDFTYNNLLGVSLCFATQSLICGLNPAGYLVSMPPC